MVSGEIPSSFYAERKGDRALISLPLLRTLVLPGEDPTLKPSFIYLFIYLLTYLLRQHPWHMEVPRLGVELDPQLSAYTTATVMPDLSCVCDLHYTSLQCWILNPLSKARDQTLILMGTSQICYLCTTAGTPPRPHLTSFISRKALSLQSQWPKASTY